MDRAADPRQTAQGRSRRDVLRRGTLAVAGLSVGAGVGFWRTTDPAAASAPSKAQDRAIFNFALLLEYLQAAFYSEAVRESALRGDVRDFAVIVSDHERAHVSFLQKALGPHARPRPRFHFGSATRDERAFLEAAVLLENTGVLAYNGQAANLTKPALAAAAEIVSVEGRHAAWISDLAGRPPAPHAADVGASSTEVVRRLQSTGFLRTS
jgi:Ferritin-like domain